VPGADSKPNEIIGGRYQILGLLGVGGMGSVYRARDLELDEPVALKMIRRELSDQPDMLERFRREVKLARRVTHENVARTFDIGEHGQQKFLTMELVDGESLAALLARSRHLPIARVVELTEAICAGLDAAHRAGVVHRDLKPDNVMLARDGRVVITDFGIARAFESGASSNTIGTLQGTPAYMAPEQVEAAAVDARTDLYALGVMLYELCTGQLPFRANSPLAQAAARLTEAAPDPRAVRPDLPDALARVIERCLMRNPGDRFVSVTEVAAVLKSMTLPGPAPAPSTPSAAAAASRRGPATRTPDRAGPLGVDDKSIAVLPLRNAGPPADDYLADGLTEDLIDTLSMTPGLRVRSRGGVMYLKGRDRDPRELGRELDVQVVVEGSLRRLGDAVRVTTKLVSVVDGFQLWAKRFDRPAGDVLQIADEAAQAIAEALTSSGAPPVRAAALLADPEVVDLYLRARHEYHKGSQAIPESIALFEQALARAPDDPLLLSAYALACVRHWFAGGPEGQRAGERARQSAERAAALAPERAEPHAALASVRLQMGDAAGAVVELRRALTIAPGLADAHHILGRILVEIGRIQDGIRHLEATLAIEPEQFAYWELARAHALLGDWSAAMKVVQDWVDRAPDNIIHWYSRLRLALWRRDQPMLEALAASTSDPRVAPMIHAALALMRDNVVPDRLLGEMGNLARNPDEGGRRMAFVFQILMELAAFAADNERALKALRRSVDAGLLDLAWLDACPLLASLRGDPRFVAMRDEVAARVAPVLTALGKGARTTT
jgi:serine/threonine-protein kinase